MRPSSRPCTAADKPINREIPRAIVPVLSDGSQMGFPSSSKSLTFPARPGFGQLGTKCIVKANHFFAELPNKNLNQYDVRSFSSLFFRGTNLILKAMLHKLTLMMFLDGFCS